MRKKYLLLLIPLLLYGWMFLTERDFLRDDEIIDLYFNLVMMTLFLFLFVKRFTMKGKIDYFFAGVFCFYIFVLHHLVFPFSIAPILFHTEIQIPTDLMWNVNLVPFQEIERFFHHVNGFSLADTKTFFFVGNLFMFAPFAFILAYFFSMKSWKIILFICFLSIGVETLQFVQTVIYRVFVNDYIWRMGRSADIDDVILNTCSALFGIWAFQIYKLVGILTKKGKSIEV